MFSCFCLDLYKLPPMEVQSIDTWKGDTEAGGYTKWSENLFKRLNCPEPLINTPWEGGGVFCHFSFLLLV